MARDIKTVRRLRFQNALQFHLAMGSMLQQVPVGKLRDGVQVEVREWGGGEVDLDNKNVVTLEKEDHPYADPTYAIIITA